MYIDILLALACVFSFYILWRRVSEKMPELELIPDQDLSILLEENTEKLQRFFLHLLHFRSFYRERHYHEKLRSFATKMLLKVHILVLRIDNGIVALTARLRAESIAKVEQVVDRKEYVSQLQERERPDRESVNRVEEVRPRRRARFASSIASSAAEKPKARLADERTRL